MALLPGLGLQLMPLLWAGALEVNLKFNNKDPALHQETSEKKPDPAEAEDTIVDPE